MRDNCLFKNGGKRVKTEEGVCICELRVRVRIRVLLAQLSLTACQRVVPNMPHLFRAGQGANEHSLEAEWYESGVGKRARNSKEMKNENDIPSVSVPTPFFLIMQPQIGDTVGGISQLKLGFIICSTVKMHLVLGMNLHTL